MLKPIRQEELRDAITAALDTPRVQPALPEVVPKVLTDGFDSAKTLQILVAEDNRVNQRVIRRLLEKRGHRVVVAANGREALTVLTKEAIDLVLMDVQMPEIDGLQATAALRRQENETGGHVPIIALTAHVMKGDFQKCVDSGMDGYLSKPIRSRKLDELLERIAGQLLRNPPVITL